MENIADIQARLLEVKASLPDGVELVAVSKFHPDAAISEAYAAGQRLFGESRVQEFCQKYDSLARLEGIQWHFIGHLQTNKVKQLLSREVALIQSVDSERLLSIIDKEAAAMGKVQRILLQVHVAKEETKFGFLPQELLDYFAGRHFESLKATHICGIMGMATNTDDEDMVRADFERIASIYDRIKKDTIGLTGFDILSMGMTGDYGIAVACGSDMVRIGSAIFGRR